MRIIAFRTLREFWEGRAEYADSKGQLEAWSREAKNAKWNSPADIKAQYRNASTLKNRRVIFNNCR